MKSVEVIIGKEGQTKVEAFGYNGKGCKAATKAIEDALSGGRNIEKDRTAKPEMFHVTNEATANA